MIAAAFAFALCTPGSAQNPSAMLHWQPWSDAVFAQARAEHKFVLLDLEAVWCHWCHVMDDITYRDPAVIRLLSEHYVLVKVDQDARPDLSNRYGDYGWPATIVFAADGSEIVKRQGYIPPRPMASMLQAIIDDPSPGPSVEKEAAFHPAETSALPPALLSRIEAEYEKQYDETAAGWGFGHKYLDRNSVEYALRLAAAGNADYAKRAAATLHQAASLIDPVWGGMYQYSVDGHWSEPHFEKLISIQADALREYSLAYAQTQNPRRSAGRPSRASLCRELPRLAVRGSVLSSRRMPTCTMGRRMRPTSNSRTLDRRAQGIPRIDTHVYARENGWMIGRSATYYAASGDESALAQAQRAAHWIAAHRSLPGGGFRHDDADPAGPYLGDTLAMGQAFLALYNVTGDRSYLKAAAAAAQYHRRAFRARLSRYGLHHFALPDRRRISSPSRSR